MNSKASPLRPRRWRSRFARTSAGPWRTKQVFCIKQADIGQIVAERLNTAWNTSGTPTAWTHRHHHFDLLGNTIAKELRG